MMLFALGVVTGVVATLVCFLIGDGLKAAAVDDPVNSAGPPPSQDHIYLRICVWCGRTRGQHARHCRLYKG